MSSQSAALVCDGCGLVASILNGHLPEGWGTCKFVPGILRRTGPRPDKHTCSVECRKQLWGQETGELKALEAGAWIP